MKLERLSLWDHQREAIASVRKYLAAYRSGETNRSTLVHLPTGSGKTLIIGVIARCLKEVKGVLVLAPRVSLRRQLAYEIRGDAFLKLNPPVAPHELPKEVIEIEDKLPSVAVGQLSSHVLCMTIQRLVSLFQHNSSFWSRLRNEVELVIVDEGHCEPARVWRAAIRGLGIPKVIFTATPYRNDLKVFDIAYEYAYGRSYHQVRDAGYVREVKFHVRPRPRTPGEFVQEVVSLYREVLRPQKLPHSRRPRVIIRCESRDTIRQIGASLRAQGESFVAIHERFRADPKRPEERKHVPKPADEPAIFWIHQFKLLEGIDDPRFRLLALFEKLGNARALIQQIGRVIRNPEKQSGPAHVLDHAEWGLSGTWDQFLEYERLLESGASVLDVGRSFVEGFKKMQPSIAYLGGQFRRGLDLKMFNPAKELLLPLAVNVYRRASSFQFKAFCDAIEASYRDQDREIAPRPVSSTVKVFLYLSFKSSPLVRTFFVEPRLGVTVVRSVGNYVCFLDSEGGQPPEFPGLMSAPSDAELRRLFSKGLQSKLVEVSLRSSNPATPIRRRTIAAASLGDSAPFVDDRAFSCATARGYSKGRRGRPGRRQSRIRRYVGFSNGRISDESHPSVTLERYLAWLNEVVGMLESKRAPISVFERYASESPPPDDPTPLSILLDVSEVQDSYFTVVATDDTEGEPMVIADACASVAADAFVVAGNGSRFRVTIRFDHEAGHYELESPELDAMYHRSDQQKSEGIVTYLNRNQAFVVIPRSKDVVYSGGKFYHPLLDFGPRYDDDQAHLLKMLFPVDELAAVTSEKGERRADDNWDPDSLFGLIDRLGRGTELEDFIGRPDIVVCDDGPNEASDFILADSRRRRVLFVHAKVADTASVLAPSKLHDVCGQAAQKVRYLAKFGTQRPRRANTWHTTAWREQGREEKRRIRRGPLDGSAWQRIEAVVRDPFAETELWLVLGRMLSKKALSEGLVAASTEAIHTANQLLPTRFSIEQVAARFRVFCSP